MSETRFTRPQDGIPVTQAHSSLKENQEKKRRRLNEVLKKLSTNKPATSLSVNMSDSSETTCPLMTSSSLEVPDKQLPSGVSRRNGGDESVGLVRKMSSAALRREQWRDNHQQSVDENIIVRNNLQQIDVESSCSNQPGEVFKFDSFDRERYLTGGLLSHCPPAKNCSLADEDGCETSATVSAGAPLDDLNTRSCSAAVSGIVHPPPRSPQLKPTTKYAAYAYPSPVSSLANTCSYVHSHHPKMGSLRSSSSGTPAPPPSLLHQHQCTTMEGSSVGSGVDGAPDCFSSPPSGRSPHSSLSSPQVSVDSPRICFSPLRIKDSIEEEEDATTGLVLHTLPRLSVKGCDSDDTSVTTTSSSGACGQTRNDGSTLNSAAMAAAWMQDNQQMGMLQPYKLVPGTSLPASTSVSRPISPNPYLSSYTPATPVSPGLRALKNLPSYVTDIYRRRCMSDTDLSCSWEDLRQSGGEHMNDISTNTRNACELLLPQFRSSSSATGGLGGDLGIPGYNPNTHLLQKTKLSSLSLVSGAKVGRYLSLPSKVGSLESETSSTATQESPLDLSVRSITPASGPIPPHCHPTTHVPVSSFLITRPRSRICSSSMRAISMDSIQQKESSTVATNVMHASHSRHGIMPRSSSVTSRARGKSLGRVSRASVGRGGSSSLGGSVDRYPDRYSLDRLDTSLLADEGSTRGGGSFQEEGHICPFCGQIFTLHDRLAKHIASRHKSRSSDGGTVICSLSGPATATNSNTNTLSSTTQCGLQVTNTNAGSANKAYSCDVCKRAFARSDMLTRHMRLHTGAKPYTCRTCGQVFSRSDHLSTHQRTHTGEKPYRCPSCPYAACRRDMITRHMRTHARYELQESASMEDSANGSVTGNDSPLSVGSGLITARSVSSDSADPTYQSVRGEPLTSPMDTEDSVLQGVSHCNGQIVVNGTQQLKQRFYSEEENRDTVDFDK